MSDSITIILPLPPKQMHPNKRSHWRAKMQPKKQQRMDAYLAALAEIQKLGKHPQWEAAEVITTWYLARTNDRDNLIAWGKATWDGLADALGSNDSGFFYWPPHQIVGKDAKGQRKLVVVLRRRAA